MICVRSAMSLALLSLIVIHSGQAFARFNTIADWLCAGQHDRARITDILVLTAGQGWSNHDDNFFAHCLDQVASDLRASERNLGEVARITCVE